MIPLNVGGYYFVTTRSTLTKNKDSMLAAMFSGRHELDTDSEGRYFIDRDGTYFIHILNFLRDRNQLPAADIALEVRIACGDSDLHIVRSRLWSRASRNRYTIPDRALKYLFRFRSPKNRVCDWLQVKN